MLNNIFRHISAERTDEKNGALLPTFYQHQKVYAFCKKFIKNKTVIEIGCGSGSGAYMLASFAKNVIGIDNDILTINENSRRHKKDNLAFQCYDIRSLEKNTFKNKADVAISLQVIEHLPDPNDLLKKIKLLLKKDGVFILSTPNGLTQSYNENPYHYKECSRGELLQLLLRYFKFVEIYGLCGDSLVNAYEEQRRKNVLRVLSLDVLNLRRFIPRRVMQVLFDIATYASRTLIKNNSDTFSTISEKDYKIVKSFDGAIDLIAICRNVR